MISKASTTASVKVFLPTAMLKKASSFSSASSLSPRHTYSPSLTGLNSGSMPWLGSMARRRGTR